VSVERKVSSRALYLQVRDHLAQQIAAGSLKPGSALPSELDLAAQLGVSPGTIRKALEGLESESLITRRQGRGTFVRDRDADTALAFDNLRTHEGQFLSGSIEFLGATSGPATAEEQERLGLSAPEPILRCEQLRDHGGPVLFERFSLAVARFPGLADATMVGPHHIAQLARERGVLLGRASETVEVADAGAEVAGRLQVDEGTPLLKLERLTYSLEREPLEWRTAYCRFGSVKYVAELRL
jgi:GntR family transcriptional regulator